MLTSLEERRRSGPLEPFEKRALAGFLAAALIQTVASIYRDRSAAPLVTSLAILGCGALWLLRVRRAPGHFLAMPAGLLIATAGIYGGYSAMNAPLTGLLTRFSVPVLLILTGALLLFAEQDWQFQRTVFVLTAIAFLIAQVVLTIETRSGGHALAATSKNVEGGVLGELQKVQIAKSFVDARNAADPNARITITQWVVDGDVVAGFGTEQAVRAVIRDGKVAQWQLYGGRP